MIVIDENIGATIVVKISPGCASRRERLLQAAGDSGLHERATARIAKEERTLAIGYIGRAFRDVFLNMAVGGEEIGKAIQIVIEKESAPGEKRYAGIAQAARKRHIL